MNNMNELASNSAVRIAIVGVLAILALFLFAETVVTAEQWGRSETPATNTITVSGDGQASVAPDVARISFSFMDTETTSASAQSVATRQMNAALDEVKKQGIDDKDIRTVSYNISPQYSSDYCLPNTFCPRDNTTVTGYQAMQTVEVTVRDLDKVGAVLQTLGQQNAQEISGPNLGLDNPNEGNDAARAAAIANAKVEAQKLAAQLGVHLGKIVSFNENGGGYPVMYAKSAPMAAGADSASAPSIPTGENQYNSSVSITYEIW